MCFNNINSFNSHFRMEKLRYRKNMSKTASTVPGTQRAVYHGLLTPEPGTDRTLSIPGH